MAPIMDRRRPTGQPDVLRPSPAAASLTPGQGRTGSMTGADGGSRKMESTGVRRIEGKE